MHIQFLSRPTVSTSTAIVSAVSRTARWFWSMAVGVNFDLQRNMTIRYVRGRYVTTRPCIECRIPATTAASPAMNPDIFVSQFTCFYRVMLYASAVLAMGLCLSLCLSVTSRCSIETGERIELVFGMWAFFQPSYTMLKGNSIISKNEGTSLWNFVLNSRLRKFRHGIDRRNVLST